MKILVTGGAGYIGSHAVVDLLGAGHEVEVVDSLANSKPSVMDRIETLTGTVVTLHEADLRDRAALDEIFTAGRFDAVFHFAGLKAVGESGAQPLRYWDVNVGGAISLLETMAAHEVRTLVFSSSATVYGDAAPVPYVETFEPLQPSNVYGDTKAAIERVLLDLAASDARWRIGILRYFNPVGAHESGLLGEDPLGIPNNLMPYICQVAVGAREKLAIYGNDYPTADGTGERDYIHVVDLAAGHRAALDAITSGDVGARAWNLGSGRPTSVLQVLAAFEGALGRSIPHEFAPRRPGDLPSYYADVTRASAELGWAATRSVADMCADSLRWQTANPEGYP